MSLIHPLNEAVFDKWQIETLYYRLYSYIVKDFLTRSDAGKMMEPTNLNVNVNAGIPAQVLGPTGTMTGATTGPGKGEVLATYKGEMPLDKAVQLELNYTTRVKTAKVAETAIGKLPT